MLEYIMFYGVISYYVCYIVLYCVTARKGGMITVISIITISVIITYMYYIYSGWKPSS